MPDTCRPVFQHVRMNHPCLYVLLPKQFADGPNSRQGGEKGIDLNVTLGNLKAWSTPVERQVSARLTRGRRGPTGRVFGTAASQTSDGAVPAPQNQSETLHAHGEFRGHL